jgi:hypothetical protein
MQKLSEPVSSIAHERNLAVWEMPVLLALLVMYFALATYKIDFPGLYYDEMLFVGPATGEQPYVKSSAQF